MSRLAVLRASEDAPTPSLRSHAGLDAVEATLVHLVVGARVDRLGHIAHEHLSGGGKRMRARLALAAFEALGGQREDALSWAAACELLHNATLIHDDLQDGDTRRRDRPTTWATWGTAQAINAGDLMLMLPFSAVEGLKTSDATKYALCRAIARRAEETVRGQALELDLLGRRRFDHEAWIRAAEGKSGALLALPVEGAALLAGLNRETAERFAQDFARLGVLYQLHDDVLDLFGDKGRGTSGNDLREGKVSALVVEHLALHPEDAEALTALLELPREATTDAMVETTIARFRDSGALSATYRRIAALERSIRSSPLLCAVPPLHALAMDLLNLLSASAPKENA